MRLNGNLKRVGEIVGANSQFNSCHDSSCDYYLFLSGVFMFLSDRAAFTVAYMKSWRDEPTQKREEVRGSGAGSRVRKTSQS